MLALIVEAVGDGVDGGTLFADYVIEGCHPRLYLAPVDAVELDTNLFGERRGGIVGLGRFPEVGAAARCRGVVAAGTGGQILNGLLQRVEKLVHALSLLEP